MFAEYSAIRIIKNIATLRMIIQRAATVIYAIMPSYAISLVEAEKLWDLKPKPLSANTAKNSTTKSLAKCTLSVAVNARRGR